MYDEQQNDQIQMKQQNDQPNQRVPIYGQVDGEKIYMGGLDYALLQKQKQQQTKKGLLSNIKNQLFNIQSKIDSRTVKSTPENPIDEQTIKLINQIKNFYNVKPLVNSSTYYVFDVRYHFGRLSPQIITKRLGRMNKEPAYIRISSQTISKFKKVLQKPMVDFERLNKDKAIKKLARSENQQSSSSDDKLSIFGSDDQSGIETNKKQEKLFNFGKKLSLGVKDQDIFNVQKPPQNDDMIYIERLEKQQGRQKDKYQFLRKKIKKTMNQDQDDGYGQCYIQSGPTFEQMKQYRSQGIQLFGELKQAPKKGEKKINIHREYDMVKKIIDSKSKGN